jgi:transcriptional regulator with XRE-family HTH domain
MSGANKEWDRSPSTSSPRRWSLTADSAAGIRTTIAENLQRERERRNLSHRALAGNCGLIPGSIARIEGSQREAKISSLVTIAIGLSVPLPSLLVGLPSPSPGRTAWVGDPSLAANWDLSPENLGLVRAILGANLLRARKRAAMSQQALAGRTHTGEDTIMRTEGGHQEPRLSTVVAWSFALSVPLLSLLSGLPSVP